MHENMHDKILFKTPFGSLQYILREIKEKTSLERILEPAAAEVFEILCDCSEMAHEVAATFLSITAQPAALITGILEKHPAAYKRFYEKLASPVGKLARCSYLQYVLGHAIIDIAFAPPMAQAFGRWANGQRFACGKAESPSHRLSELCNEIAGNADTIRQQLQLSASQISIGGPMDVEDYWDKEEWWETAPGNIARSLDDELSKVAWNCLKDISNAMFPTIESTQWLAELEEYMQSAKLISQEIQGPIVKQGSLGSSILRPTQTRLVNPLAPKAGKLGQLNVLTSVEDIFQTRGLPYTLLHSPHHPQTDGRPDWLRGVIDAERDGVVTHRLPSALFDKAIGQMAIMGRLGGMIFRLPPMLILCQSSQTDHFMTTYNSLCPRLGVSVGGGIMDLGLDRLFWYMGGDFLEWLSFFEGLGQWDLFFTISQEWGEKSAKRFPELDQLLAAGKMPLELPDAMNGMNFSDDLQDVITEGHDKATSLMVFKNAGICGYFIKMVQFWLLGDHIRYVMTQCPKITVSKYPASMGSGKRERLLEDAGPIIQSVMSLWEEF